MSFQYKVGDVLKKVKSVSRTDTLLTVVGHKTTGIRGYMVTSNAHGHNGRPYFKERRVLEDPALYVAHTGSVSVMMSKGGFKQQAEEEFFCDFEIGEIKVSKIKSLCDCGGHKCGYRDDELHGHANWCTLVKHSEIKEKIEHIEESF
jgi:hypothetical protein